MRSISRSARSLRTYAFGLLLSSALSLSIFCTGTVLAQGNDDPDDGGPVLYGAKVYKEIPKVGECEADVMIGDCTSDIGDEPNNNCSHFWNSPYIWVRNQQDGFTNTTNQSPIAGQDNWVYIALHNRGFQTLNNGIVHVYFAKASTGLYWPASWDDNFQPNCANPQNTTTYGDLIGSETVVSLLSNQDAIVRILWPAATVPDPADFCNNDAHHFCMLARFISPEDPMTYIETSNTPYNTQYNNNIAWKNQTILNRRNPVGPVDVHNGTKKEQKERLVFTIPENEREENILDHARIHVDLGDGLKEQWKSAGEQGTGVRDAGGSLLEITEFDAKVEGLTFKPGQTANLSVKVTFNDPPEAPGKVFNFDLAQYDSDAPGEEGETVRHLVGGETFTVTIPEEDEGRNVQDNGHAATTPQGNTLAEALRLTVHPNPTKGMTTITYTLPTAMPVTLSIYDVTGKLVRTLVNGVEQSAGIHTIEWNGTAADNNTVASGTYFYRIETPRGTAQQQLGVTR